MRWCSSGLNCFYLVACTKQCWCNYATPDVKMLLVFPLQYPLGWLSLSHFNPFSYTLIETCHMCISNLLVEALYDIIVETTNTKNSICMTPLATVLFVARCAQSTSCYRWKAVAPELFTAHKCSKICWKQKIKCQMPCPHPTGWWWGGGGPLATWEWKTAHWNFKADYVNTLQVDKMTPLATVLFVARCAQSTSCYRWKAVAPELFTAHKCSKICWKQKIKCQMPCPHPKLMRYHAVSWPPVQRFSDTTTMDMVVPGGSKILQRCQCLSGHGAAGL